MKTNSVSIENHTSSKNGEIPPEAMSVIEQFAHECDPVEKKNLLLMEDFRTGALFVECHVRAAKLIELGTIDVPLDPEDQQEYRANRDLVEDHVAFSRMKEDALSRRTFSNIVSEFTHSFDSAHPLKIIGGQHRFEAIRNALANNVNEWHGLKVYFNLDPDQRIDVQLISNTNIAVSTDLFDRMQETLAGPELRSWCQAAGLLEAGQDFADKRARTNPITVRAARTFISNYLLGRAIPEKIFAKSETIPTICKSGVTDPDWEKIRASNPNLWKDKGMLQAGQEFAALIAAQRNSVKATAKKGKAANVDFAEKAMNFAVLSAWAFVAGMLQKNKVRLDRHFALKAQKGRDPLFAAALAKGKHKSDSENYRGLGYRTDAKERGRFVELFYMQTEKGEGISAAIIDVAIKKFHAKEALLEAEKASQKALS